MSEISDAHLTEQHSQLHIEMRPNYTFEFLTSPCFQLRHHSRYSTVTTDCDLKMLTFGGQNLAGDKSHGN